MSDESETRYKRLNYSLNQLLDTLEESLDSVNIRDECSSKPIAIKLQEPTLSLLNRRRSMMPFTIEAKH